MKKQRAGLNILFWGTVLLVSSTTFIVYTVFGKNIFLGFENNFINVKEEIINENVDKIDISWISGKLDLLKSNDNTVKIIQKANKGFSQNKLFSYSLNNNKLVVKDERGGNKISINNTESNLEVYLPEKLYEEIKIKSVSSDVNGGLLNSKKMNASSTSGDISFLGEFDDVELSSVSGDFKLENCTVKNSINAKTTSGDIEGNDISSENLQLKSVSGDIDVNGSFLNIISKTTSGDTDILSSTPVTSIDGSSISGEIMIEIPDNEGFEINFNSISGDFSNEFGSGNDKKNYVYKNGKFKYKIKTTSGDFILKKKQDIKKTGI